MIITTIGELGGVLPNSLKTKKLANIAKEVFGKKRIEVLQFISCTYQDIYRLEILCKGKTYQTEVTIKPDTYLSYKDQFKIIAFEASRQILKRNPDEII